MEAVELPLEPFTVDGLVGGHGEDADLLAREAGKGAAAGHGAETAVFGEHLDVGPSILLGEGDQITDVAQRVVLAAAGGANNVEC